MDQTNQFKVNQPTSSSPPSVAGNFLHVCKVNVQLLYFFYNYCPPLQPLIFSINILSFILIENWLLRKIIESKIKKKKHKITLYHIYFQKIFQTSSTPSLATTAIAAVTQHTATTKHLSNHSVSFSSFVVYSNFLQ